VIDRLAGSYAKTNGGKDAVFYKKAGLLWVQNPESINGGYALEYVGNNTFEVYGSPAKFEFKPEMDGLVKLSYTGRNQSWVAVKKK
jgi:hypothetical protein